MEVAVSEKASEQEQLLFTIIGREPSMNKRLEQLGV